WSLDGEGEVVLLYLTRTLPRPRRRQHSRPQHSLRQGTQRRFQRLGRQRRKGDPRLRPGHNAPESQLRSQRDFRPGKPAVPARPVHGLRRQESERDLPVRPRFQSSLAAQWFKFLPQPTFGGALNNYVVPVPVGAGIFNDSNLWDIRIDYNYGDKDHFFGSHHSRRSFAPAATQLPPQLAQEQPYQTNWTVMPRVGWDHTFSATLLNHVAFGYNDT